MKINFTSEIYDEALIMIEVLRLDITSKVLDQLGTPSSNRSAAASLHIASRR